MVPRSCGQSSDIIVAEIFIGWDLLYPPLQATLCEKTCNLKSDLGRGMTLSGVAYPSIV